MTIRFDLMGTCPTGERYIRIRWTCGGAVAWLSARKKIFPAFWRNGIVKAPMHSTVVNSDGWTADVMIKFLDAIVQRCRRYENRYLDGVGEDELKRLLKESIEQAAEDASTTPAVTSRHQLHQIVCIFIKEEGVRREWTPATAIQYKKLLRLLDAYKPYAFVEDLNLTWAEGFFSYLVERLSERTVHSMMINFRSFVKWTIQRYRVDERALRFSYKTRENVKDLVFLNANELRALAELKIPDDGKFVLKYPPMWSGPPTIRRHKDVLEESRDMYLFCCLTGLRFSDMQRLEWVHVFSDCIKMYTKKTMKHIEVALNPISQAILDRRWECRNKSTDDPDAAGEGYVFPRISNTLLNAHLKVIGKMLGLDEKISSLVFKGGKRIETFKKKSAALTTHSGRHTFAVQALSAGVPGSVVMSWTGHSDYNSLKPYLGITSDAKEKGMRQFEEYMKDAFEPDDEQEK